MNKIREYRDGLTQEIIDKKFAWLNDADFCDAVLGLENSRLVWYNGTWHNGTWHGTWHNGTWHNGTWHGGTWKYGTWNGGTWHGGTWINGTWNGGTWRGGTWISGTWNSGTWRGGTTHYLSGEKIMNIYEYIQNIARQTAAEKGFDETLYNAVSYIYRTEYSYAVVEGKKNHDEATEYATNVLQLILDNERPYTVYQYRIECGLELDPDKVFDNLPEAE